MSALWWILLSGLAMSVLALVGSVALLLPERTFKQVVLPLVAVAAGALLGGALFHMLPEAVCLLGNHLVVYVWMAAGILLFLVLEQFLHWHHCHRAVADHKPLGYLILVADGLHNLIGGLAVGGAFVVDIRLGLVAWLVAAAHEVPQELGDFGILVHPAGRSRSTWPRRWPFCSVACRPMRWRARSTSRCWCRSRSATSSTSLSRTCCRRSRPRPSPGGRSCTRRASCWGSPFCGGGCLYVFRQASRGFLGS
ncbi:ZIP family metal transporter [Streptomyces fradiae]|uniref:ZIP family metal transporter n=1 Tax=Streptomyces fradiae TaxID=1906 RepID=UPI0039884B65